MRDLFTLVGVIGAILVLAITITVISNGQPAEQPQEAKIIFCKDINDKYIVAFRMGTALHLIYEGSISSIYLSRADRTIGIVSAGREIRTNLKPKDFFDARLKYQGQLKTNTVPIWSDMPDVLEFFNE